MTRKNAGSSRNGGTARNAAGIWTATATTAGKAGLSLQAYLTAYLDACGRNGGKPLTGPALERFLPLDRQPRRPPCPGQAAASPGRNLLR